ncbi:MAG: hypothetical protein ACP5DC_07980 [Halothiobacillaceae bacterium]
MPCQRLLIGLRRWDDPALDGLFYPEDLPDGWRLDFLAGTTSAIWLEPGQVDEDALAVIADAPPSLRVVIEAPEDEAMRASLSVWASAHKERVLALVDAPSELAPGVRHLDHAQIWHPQAEVQDVPVGVIPATADLRALRGWVDAFAEGPAGGGCALFVSGSPPPTGTLENLRTLLEVMGW